MKKLDEIVGFKTSAKVRAEIVGITYYQLHSHLTCTELLCVLKGNISVLDFAIEYKLSPGSIHIFNSNEPHKIISSDPNSQVLIIHFDKEHYLQYFDTLELAYFVAHMPEPAGINCAEMRYLRMLMAKIYTEYVKTSPSDIYLEELTIDLIKLLYNYFHNYSYSKTNEGYEIIRNLKYNNEEYIFNRAYRIADYIESNYYRKLTLDEVANNEYMNPTYLSRYIKDNLGVTFSELVSIARCSEVERLLISTSLSIDTIAEKTGFSNRSHLTTQFKRWYNLTPAEYRKQAIKDYSTNNYITYHEIEEKEALAVIEKYLNG